MHILVPRNGVGYHLMQLAYSQSIEHFLGRPNFQGGKWREAIFTYIELGIEIGQFDFKLSELMQSFIGLPRSRRQPPA